MHVISTTLAAAATPSGTTGFFFQLMPLLFVFVIFYVLMIRPQQRRMKQHQAMIAAVKKGDQVVTAGGIRGKVTRVAEADGEVEVEIAQGVKVRVIASTLSQVIDPKAKPAND